MRVEISIVIPIYCEQENLADLYSRLMSAIEPLGKTFEIIFVDDASRDDSPRILNELREKDRRVRIVRLSRNFGHQAAITAGLDLAAGEWVIVMDGDLQDPPEMIPALFEKQREGDWDVVYGVRERRPENPLFRAVNTSFYALLRITASVAIPSEAGDFCLMRRRVVEELRRMPERSRFIRGLRAWVGFRQTELAFVRPQRHAGSAKYTFPVRTRLALDAIFGFSFVPLRVSTVLGVLLSFAGFFYALHILVGRLSGRFTVVPGWATVVISVLVLGGVQLLMLGIIGEYLGRIYEELKGRPRYVIAERIGFDDEAAP